MKERDQVFALNREGLGGGVGLCLESATPLACIGIGPILEPVLAWMGMGPNRESESYLIEVTVQCSIGRGELPENVQ